MQVTTSMGILEGDGTMPLVPMVHTTTMVQPLGVQHVAVMVPWLDEIYGVGIFLRPVTGQVMTGEEHDMFWSFSKIKAPVFYCTNSKNACEFIIGCHERLYKMGLMERYGVEFVSFQRMGVTKLLWRAYVECRLLVHFIRLVPIFTPSS